MDEREQRLASQLMSRVAKQTPLDVQGVKQFRKDFLVLMKNAPRIDSSEMAHSWKDVVSRWRTEFDDYLYKYLLKGLKDAAWRKEVSEEFANYWDDKIRTDTWTFVTHFQVPINEADSYWTKEMRYNEFVRELPKWERTIRRKARPAWKTLTEFVQEYERQFDSLPVSDLPAPEEMMIEGFPVIFKGHDSAFASGYFPKHLEMIKHGLKSYKSSASRMLPVLLNKKIPFVVDYGCKFGLGGEYVYKSVVLCFGAFENVHYLVKVIAHEMAHHLWSSYLSGKDKDYWMDMIAGDLGELDLRDVIKEFGDKDWFFDNKEMMRKAPFMYNQLMGLEYSASGELARVTQIKELKEYLAQGGNPIVRVKKKPISGYANKNSEEAFCEAIGLLVAYGKNTVHPEVRSWVRTILPSLRTAGQTESPEEMGRELRI